MFLVFIKVERKNLRVMGTMAGDIGFGQGMIPHLQQSIATACCKYLLRSWMPFYLVTVFHVPGDFECYFTCLAIPQMDCTVVAAGYKERVFERTLYGVNLAF